MPRRRRWTPIEGFEGYSVSPQGEVRRDDTKRILEVRFNQYGNAYVGLMRDGVQCARSLALLVARAYLEQPNKFYDTPINLDGNRGNNHVDNLMWRPRAYAVKYNRQFEDRYERPIHAPVRVVGEREVFPDSFAAARHFGLLEREVVLSVLMRTFTWPTYQFFEMANPD